MICILLVSPCCAVILQFLEKWAKWELNHGGKNLCILHFDFPFKRKWSVLVMFASFSLFSTLYLENVNTKSWVSEVVPSLYLNWSSLLWLHSSCTCKTRLDIHNPGLDRHWVRDMELNDRTDLPKDTLMRIKFHLNWVTFTRKWLSAKHKAAGKQAPGWTVTAKHHHLLLRCTKTCGGKTARV